MVSGDGRKARASSPISWLATAVLTPAAGRRRGRCGTRLAAARRACWAFPLVGAGIGLVAGAAFFAGRADRPRRGRRPRCSRCCAGGRARPARCTRTGSPTPPTGSAAARDREQKLAIMRDSRHGAYGVLALIFSIGLRAAALAAHRRPDPCRAGAGRGARRLARRACRSVMRLLAPARDDGLGAAAGRPSAAGGAGRGRIGAVDRAGAASGPPAGIAALLACRRRGRASRRCLRGARSAATPATFSAPSSKSERSSCCSCGADRRRNAIGPERRRHGASTTRFWWVRHAPVDHDGRIYGQKDMPCDCSDAAVFAGLARQLPRDAGVGHQQSAPHPRDGAGDRRAPACPDPTEIPGPDAPAIPELAEQSFRRVAGPDLRGIAPFARRRLPPLLARPGA